MSADTAPTQRVTAANTIEYAYRSLGGSDTSASRSPRDSYTRTETRSGCCSSNEKPVDLVAAAHVRVPQHLDRRPRIERRLLDAARCISMADDIADELHRAVPGPGGLASGPNEALTTRPHALRARAPPTRGSS